MKHKGASFPYKKQRELELMNAFKQVLSESKHIRMDDIFGRVVNRPCSRFWVSEERATIAVSTMLRGCGGIVTNKLKRKMYNEIFCRYKKLRLENPRVPMSHIIYSIVNSPAPQFYLSPSQAKIVINKARAKHYSI